MDRQLEQLHHMSMYGVTFWFICAKDPGMYRSAALVIGNAILRLSSEEQAELRCKTVRFVKAECHTTDPMEAFALMNAKPELEVRTVQRWVKQLPGAAIQYVTPPTGKEPIVKPEPEKVEPVSKPVVAPKPLPEAVGEVKVTIPRRKPVRQRTK
jgi:hypothetical protein